MPTPSKKKFLDDPPSLPFFLDADRLHYTLYLPNIIGYIRVLTLVGALMQEDPGSAATLRLLVLSLGLDFIDGPAARRFDMCTQFGDLLDHYTDHATMMFLVYLTYSQTLLGHVNLCVNVLCNGLTVVYMLYTGHYFKHSANSNVITRVVEANNFFNMPALFWNANTILIPFIKMSYHIEHQVPMRASTEMIDVFDYAGLLVTLVYTLATFHAARK